MTFGVTLGGLYKFRSKIVGPYLGLKQNILKSVRIDGVTFIRCAWNFVELCPEESLASKVNFECVGPRIVFCFHALGQLWRLGRTEHETHRAKVDVQTLIMSVSG